MTRRGRTVLTATGLAVPAVTGYATGLAGQVWPILVLLAAAGAATFVALIVRLALYLTGGDRP